MDPAVQREKEGVDKERVAPELDLNQVSAIVPFTEIEMPCWQLDRRRCEGP